VIGGGREVEESVGLFLLHIIENKDGNVCILAHFERLIWNYREKNHVYFYISCKLHRFIKVV